MIPARPDGQDAEAGPTVGACLLVFGVSGVGKTSACQAFVARHPEFLYFRASQLLSEALAATPDELRTASAERIEANQELLGHGLAARRAPQLQRPVLVDVHGVIDNDRELVQVPVRTVQSLAPDGLILLENTPDVVAARRRHDPRPRPERTLEQLAQELAAERAAVEQYARALNVPWEAAHADDGFFLESVALPLLDVLRGHR